MSTLTVKDGTGATVTIKTLTDGSGNLVNQHVVSDSTGAALVGQKVAASSIPVVLSSDAALPAGTNVIGKLGANSGTVIGDVNPVSGINAVVNVATSYTRPADTTAYAAGDCYNSSTSSPTVLTFANAARASGKGGIIVSMTVVDSNAPGTPIQGELWLFDSAPTATNDNAALAVSDSDALKLLAIIPFTTTVIDTNNSTAFINSINTAFQCSGSADLKGLVRVTNAYTPASAEVLNFRLGIIQGD